MLKSLFYIFFFLIVGEIIKYLFQLPIAGNILGMILIFISLKLNWIKLEMVKQASDKLLEYMVLFFIPYGVGIMVYFDLIENNWIALVLATFISTILTLLVTGWTLQKMENND